MQKMTLENTYCDFQVRSLGNFSLGSFHQTMMLMEHLKDCKKVCLGKQKIVASVNDSFHNNKKFRQAPLN